MSMTEYSYVVLKYRHDPSAGEVMNVGVLMYAQSGQVGFLWSERYGRLSEAFANFDGRFYRTVMESLATGIEGVRSRTSEDFFEIEERRRFADVGEILRSIWPDQGLSYFASPVLFGMCSDFDTDLRELYDRFVLSQHDARDVQERINDEAVWSTVRKALSKRGVDRILHRTAIGPAEVEFQHAYRNGKWHAIEPVSLDYANSGEIKQRALRTVGKAAAVQDLDEFGTFHIIVRKPHRIPAGKQYDNAMILLRDIRVDHEIIFDDQVDAFAAKLETEMRKHNLLPQEQKLA